MTPTARRAMSVWSPRWPITRLKRRMGPAYPAGPQGLATMTTEDNARRLAAVDETAAALGAVRGQTVADALALNPALALLEAEPEEDEAALGRLADWCERFAPAVAVDPPDGLFLDVTGCARLWGGERELAETLRARLGAEGIPARIAIAPTFGAAWALARFGGEEVEIAPGGNDGEALPPPPCGEGERGWGSEGTSRLSPDDNASPPTRQLLHRSAHGADPHPPPPPRKGEGRRNFSLVSPLTETFARLAPLPLAALRLEPGVHDKLRRLGLKTVADVARLPRAALRKRVGTELALRLAQALGEADEPLAFRRPPRPWLARCVFAEPIGAPEDLARAVRDLAEDLCARLDAAGLGARAFEAVFHRVDSGAARRAVSMSLPAREPARLTALFAPKLETLDPGFGVEVAALIADIVEPVRAAQTDLAAAAADARAADLAPLIDRLCNRLGPDRVWRAGPCPSHVPERAVTRLAPLGDGIARLSLDEDGSASPDPPYWPQPRPVRLFARPQPIEAIAPVPDDPPLLFRWRGRLHRIRRAEGPERIGAEWWRAPWADVREDGVERVRDYYRVEDEAGARFWVFRTGVYGGERPARWWLHGVFV